MVHFQECFYFNLLYSTLRAGSGTVQLVTGWEKICLPLMRPGSPVRTMDLPLLPLPIGTYSTHTRKLTHTHYLVIKRHHSVLFWCCLLKNSFWILKGSSRPSPTAWYTVARVIPSGSASMTRAAPALSTGSVGMKCHTPTGIETSQVGRILYVWMSVWMIYTMDYRYDLKMYCRMQNGQIAESVQLSERDFEDHFA